MPTRAAKIDIAPKFLNELPHPVLQPMDHTAQFLVQLRNPVLPTIDIAA